MLNYNIYFPHITHQFQEPHQIPSLCGLADAFIRRVLLFGRYGLDDGGTSAVIFS